MTATDRIRAIHREATSSPWDEPWSLEADADEHGYARDYTITTEVGWIATFAYGQHLELFVQAKRHMEALCDLADAARRVPDDGEIHGTTHDRFGYLICADCRSPWPCPTSAIRDALSRLDAEDGP